VNLQQVDLNLLVFLDVLLREQNVTRAAEQLSTRPRAASSLERYAGTATRDTHGCASRSAPCPARETSANRAMCRRTGSYWIR
jgi:hypothetical protein